MCSVHGLVISSLQIGGFGLRGAFPQPRPLLSHPLLETSLYSGAQDIGAVAEGLYMETRCERGRKWTSKDLCP